MAVDKRGHILEHAITLFADKGFEGTSIRDLSKVAGVNVAMINYYFGSKEKLVEAIISDKALYMKDRIEEIEANPSLSELNKIDILIEDYVTRILSGVNFHKFLHKELMDIKREGIHASLTTLFSKNARNFAAIIDKGIEKKQFRKVDALLTVTSILGSITQVVSSKSMCNKLLLKQETNEPYTDEEFRERLINHIKQMIHAHLVVSDQP
ncbi:TetR family transcriptional regulator [Parasediminibacterium sp. JCM 36343]|uniref:TetR family transcriptional regulator n=1 Tax=Parasediminibacterium sp. JCM 36343 TaxID=3374279 RepID=UPI00397E14F5